MGAPSFFCKLLLEPRSNVVANPEVVSDNAHPACTPYQHCSDNLTNEANRLLEDVEYAPDSANQTCQIKNCSHFSSIFKLNISCRINTLIVLHIAQE